MEVSKGIIEITSLGVVDILDVIKRRNGKYIKITLDELENVDGLDPETFQAVRKVVLDNFNGYQRSLVKLFLGDVEDKKYGR